jgi:TetR/AcrR family transcriptional repressor of nem operon
MVKTPDQTRQILLASAFQQMQVHGFQGTSISKILAQTGLTKGALYHHFKNKNEIGYAVIEEMIQPEIVQIWVLPLSGTSDPIKAIPVIITGLMSKLTDHELKCGCPLNNMIQEMSPLDDMFRKKLNAILDMWTDALTKAFARGQESGTVHKEHDPKDLASFLIIIFEGISSMSKSKQDESVISSCQAPFSHFLSSLKP